MQRSCWILLATGAAIVLLGCNKSGTPHSTTAGVYSAEQAAHGKDMYVANCISCHAGMGNHTGPVFRARWGGYSLQDLYSFISTNMPKNDPGTLSADDYVAVIAYLMQLNNMPAGKSALPVDTVALKAIIYDTVAAKP